MSVNDSSCAAPVEKSGTVEYRTLKRFPGYRFGSDGSVLSSWKHDDWTLLKPSKNLKNGYLFVHLRIAPRRMKFMQVHALILEAFVGPCPEGCEARHFPDRNKENNSVGNLSWATRMVNANDRNLHGTKATCDTHGRRKMTGAIVTEARARFAAGETIANLAREQGVDFSTMHCAVRRKTWKAVA